MARKPLYPEIFLTSLGALLLEISYTRIFSFKVFYYFTYLILGVGLLGIGAGGIAIATSERLRKVAPEKLVPAASFAAGLSVLVGYVAIAPTRVDIAQAVNSPVEVATLLFVSLLLTFSFFLVGLVVSTILSTSPESSNRLYGADLLGAALGCTVAVPFISLLTPPRTVILSGFILALSGVRLARASKPLLGFGVATLIALAVPLSTGVLVRDPTVATSKQYEDYRKAGMVKHTAWSPVFRVDVVDHIRDTGNTFLVFHDGQPGSGIRRFDGTFDRFEYLSHDARALPFAVLPPEPKVLIIGAAGGHEIVASLYFKAGHVTGVELNPATYDVVTKVFADVTGHLERNPKVTYLNGDGRWFMKKGTEKYDLIWFVAPDSYAAMNAATSGAFVLSESYLYTVEMLKDSLSRLSDHGIICTQFGELAYGKKPNRTTRYVSTARAALAEVGIDDFGAHVLVASGPGWPPFSELAVLLSKSPYSPEQIAAFQTKLKDIPEAKQRYAPGSKAIDAPVNRVITMPRAELASFYENHPYQVDPVRDDAPFFWHFARFREAMKAPLPGGAIIVDQEDTIAEQITLAFLVIVIVLAALFLLLPLFTIRAAFREMPHKALSGVYFAALGLGFMFLEVAMIQKLTLFLGYPTYSLSVTLFSLLVFSGIGSLASSRWADRRGRSLATVVGFLAVWVVSAQFVLPFLVDHFVGSALAVRIFLTILLVAPMGLCLGGFMPLGLRTVSRISKRSREYVAWAWAVNGFFSVIASVLSTILSMVIGFRWLMIVALVIYAVGALALSRIPEAPAGDAT